MEDFFKLYNQWSMSKKKDEFGKKTLNEGLKILDKNVVDNNCKELILTKLIYIDSKNTELYYRMGMLSRGISIEREILWYKMGYNINPYHFNNFFALCKSLIINKNYQLIVELNVDNIFDRYTHEIELLYYYVESMLAVNNIKNCLKYALLVNDYFIKKDVANSEEAFFKWNSFVNCAKIYFLLGNIENSIKYMEYALEYAKKTTVQQYIIESIQKKIALYDHKYYDNKKHYENVLSINYYLRDTPIFALTNKNNNNKHKKIRVGYLSSDYSLHAVSNFIFPILKYHNNNKFDVYMYSNQEIIHPMFKPFGLNHYTVFNMKDIDAAKLINKHEIDILIDLNGFTSGNRLGILAFRPAPIQITYIGYPNTTGLKYIQYRITDEVSNSINSKQLFSEELIRLPRCFLLYESIYQREPVKLKETVSNNVILGSLNKEPKNSIQTLNTWKQILKTCSNAKLLIKIETYDNIEERLKYYMKFLDVDKARLIIIQKMDDNEYVQLFSKIDILLDTFPYSGTTTSCNALYNSIPIITLYNENYHVHNVTSSILINSGLPELVAKDEENYITIACNLINDSNRINEYKKNIRKMFLDLMEPIAFMKTYEEELTKLYNKHVL